MSPWCRSLAVARVSRFTCNAHIPRLRPPDEERAMKSVLVVDDEPHVRALVRDVLEMSGYAVREACNGTEAMSAIEIETPDCVVMDVMMPGMSGIDVLT